MSLGSTVSPERVLTGVSFNEARTTQEIADMVCGAESWALRGTVRNRLYALERRGLVICDEQQPMRWVRPDPTLSDFRSVEPYASAPDEDQR